MMPYWKVFLSFSLYTFLLTLTAWLQVLSGRVLLILALLWLEVVLLQAAWRLTRREKP